MRTFLKMVSAILVISTVVSYSAFAKGGSSAISTWLIVTLLDSFELLVAYKTFLSENGTVKSSSIYLALLLLTIGLAFPYMTVSAFNGQNQFLTVLFSWVILLSPFSNWGILLLAGKRTAK